MIAQAVSGSIIRFEEKAALAGSIGSSWFYALILASVCDHTKERRDLRGAAKGGTPAKAKRSGTNVLRSR